HGDAFADELRIDFRTMELRNIDVDLAIGPFLDIGVELGGLGTFAADDDAGARCVNRDAKLVRHPLDFDIADTRVVQLFLEVALQFEIFMKQAAVITFCKPARTPRLGNAQTESVRMCLLTHLFPLSKFDRDVSGAALVPVSAAHRRGTDPLQPRAL